MTSASLRPIDPRVASAQADADVASRRHRSGIPRMGGGGDASFFALIQSSVSNGTNRWTYTLKAAHNSTGMTWVANTGAVNFTAYHLSEVVNPTTGGSPQLNLRAIPNGTPVLVRPTINDSGTTTYWFSAAIDPVCA